MFVNKERLPHVLRPQLYFCPQQFEREMSTLFAPAWHMVGTVADLARHGDFITRELMGTPILIRNFDGEIHTFLNVCPHRHCLLTHESKGHTEELKCQYHAWEFLKNGHTGRIPDAQSFRPMPGGPECLQKFRTQVCGPLIFVTLDDNSRNLTDLLGPLEQVCNEFSVSRWRQAGQWSYEFDVNWKVVIENTVESYHVPTVHPKTLVKFGDESEIEHQIHPDFTIMRSPICAPAMYVRVANLLLPFMQPGSTYRYNLYHGFPSLFLIRIDTLFQVMTVEPTSPESCRLNVYVFTLRAAKETLISRTITACWGRFKTMVIKQVLAEDARLYPDLQRGMKSSPFQGTISTREELVYAFQDYVHRHTEVCSEHNAESCIREDELSA